MAEIKNISKFKKYLERARKLINAELDYVNHLVEEATGLVKSNDGVDAVEACFSCFVDDDDITLAIVKLLAREDNETLL